MFQCMNTKATQSLYKNKKNLGSFQGNKNFNFIFELILIILVFLNLF